MIMFVFLLLYKMTYVDDTVKTQTPCLITGVVSLGVIVCRALQKTACKKCLPGRLNSGKMPRLYTESALVEEWCVADSFN